MLEYFGEQPKVQDCQICDVCLARAAGFEPAEGRDFTAVVKLLLTIVHKAQEAGKKAEAEVRAFLKKLAAASKKKK